MLVVSFSLLLCVATIVLWVRSYRKTDWLSWARDGPRNLNLITGRGDFVVNLVTRTDGSSWRGRGWRHSHVPAVDMPGQWLRWSSERRTILWLIIYGRRTTTGGGSLSITVLIPYWLVVCLTLATPAALVTTRYRAYRRKRAGEHVCPVCGYDLRATP